MVRGGFSAEYDNIDMFLSIYWLWKLNSSDPGDELQHKVANGFCSILDLTLTLTLLYSIVPYYVCNGMCNVL